MLGVGAAGCWPRTWTALLRLDRLRVRFRWSIRSQTVQRQPDGPTAGRWSGCGGAFCAVAVALDVGARVVNGARGRPAHRAADGCRCTRGQRSRCRRPWMSPAWPAAGPGLVCAPGWAVGPVHRQRCTSRWDKGGRVGDQRPWHAQQTSAVGRQLGAKVSRIGVNTPPRPAGALRFVGIMRIWRAASGGGSSFVPNLDTSPTPPTTPTELDRHIYRTRWSYLPNSMVISTELGEHGATGRTVTSTGLGGPGVPAPSEDTAPAGGARTEVTLECEGSTRTGAQSTRIRKRR